MDNITTIEVETTALTVIPAAAANKAHRAKVNNEVLADLIAAINDNQGGELSESVTEDVAKAVIVAVAKETVRHMKVIY